jgi:probable HAF family extracellular repeat protein
LRINAFKPFVLAVLLAPAAGLPAMADYQLVDLGVDVSPKDINEAGTVVGSRTLATGSTAFVWTADGGIEDIAAGTVANAVNDLGEVTGNTLTGAFLYDGSVREWDGYGGFGINEAGQISGNKELDNPYRPVPLPLDPAIYTPNKWDNLGIARTYSRGTRDGVYADLYTLHDINEAGYAVGQRRKYGIVNGNFSFLTTPAFDDITILPIPYGGGAAAINNQNMVVGTTGTSSSTGEYAHAYLYDYDADILTDLGTLNDGLTSAAYDINDSNQVVGTSWLVTQLTSLYEPEKYHAFLWDEAGGMVDINDFLPAGSDWILTSAAAINDRGDIVGTGLVNGEVHGFLLTTDQAPPPPPPANEPPVAVADADVTSGRAPLTVDFFSTGTYDPDGDPITYRWDFGDGGGSTAADPTHTYTEVGTYVAVLTVTDDAGLMASAEVVIKARKGGKK